jgi:hypothetical protein
MMNLSSTVHNNHLLSPPGKLLVESIDHLQFSPTPIPREKAFPRPNPLVLGPSLRLPTDLQLFTNPTEVNGKTPVVLWRRGGSRRRNRVLLLSHFHLMISVWFCGPGAVSFLIFEPVRISLVGLGRDEFYDGFFWTKID